MSESMIQPKVCAVCGQVCDRYRSPLGNESWVHTLEVIGRGDHVCIPVDYDAVRVNVVCDFCHMTVPYTELWSLPCENFYIPTLQHWMMGGWACDRECALIATARDWEAMVERYRTSPHVPGGSTARSDRHWEMTKQMLMVQYGHIEKHMLGEPRPYRAGDEKIVAVSPELSPEQRLDTAMVLAARAQGVLLVFKED